MIKLIATLGGIGYSRIAPGTCGSLAALVIYFFIKENAVLYGVATLFLLTLGFLVSGKAEGIFAKKDPHPVVIDEACGLLIALFMVPFSYGAAILGFLVFRTIDVIKPFPIRRLEGLHGSLGIMSDDILAGVYANLLTRIVLKFLPTFLP
jgi:phosphatidylglycerophosphatase A